MIYLGNTQNVLHYGKECGLVCASVVPWDRDNVVALCDASAERQSDFELDMRKYKDIAVVAPQNNHW